MAITNTRIIKTVNGITIKQPTTLGFEFYNLTKSGRVASGKMTGEIIAQKRKFTLAYDVLSGPQFEDIMTACGSTKMFLPLVYIDNGVEKTAIVYSGAIKRRRFRTDGIWYWSNVTFDLIEQ